MSYAKDWTYIYIYHTKLIKKQKQTFKIEKHPMIYFKFNLLTPFDYNWSLSKAWFTFLFTTVLALNYQNRRKGHISLKNENLQKFQLASSNGVGCSVGTYTNIV